MIFYWIELENFKCFSGKHRFDISAKAGLYYIRGNNLAEPEQGSNGVGKSTLWDAFFWAWTGRTIGDNRPGAAVEPWEGKGKVSVTLYFGAPHDIKLTRTRRPNSLTLNGEVVEQAQLSRVLGMSEDNLRRTMLIGQKGDLFLDLRAEDQSRMFTDMLDLNLWLSAAELAGKKAGAAERTASEHLYQAENADGRVAALDEEIENEKQKDAEFSRRKDNLIKAAERNVSNSEDAIGDHGDKKAAQSKPIDLRKMEDAIERLRSSLTPLVKQEAEVTRRFTTITTQLAALKDVGVKYKGSPTICPECGQKVDKRHTADKMKENEKLISGANYELDVLDADLRLVQQRITRIQKDIKDQETELRSTRLISEQDRRELEIWQREHDRLQTQLSYDEKALKEARNLSNPHSAAIKGMRERLKAAEQQAKDQRELAEQFQWRADTLRYWMQAYREIRLNLIDDTLLEIEIAANRHTEALGLIDWKISFATDRELKSGVTSYGFVTFIHPPDQPEPIKWESFSGGQQQRLQLAVTFALSEVLLARAGITTNLEVIDEPTKFLSQQGIDDLIEVLRDRALDLDRCVYLVDHTSLDRGAFDGVITIERSKEGSRIVV
jgi:DNA repair exonuclease SbcCD ATPase subunit